MPTMKKNHFKKWKEEELNKLKEELKNANTIAIADIKDLPANAMMDFRKILKENGFKVKVSKVRIIKKALEELGYKELSDKYTNDAVAVVYGNENPFTMFSLIKKNASSAGAKIGMIAPEDIIVPEGDTGIPPGPALSDFKAVKIDTQIRNGHIYVPKDYVVAKKDSVIDAKVAAILTKLNIKPIKVLLKIKGAYEKADKILYDASILDIDLDAVKNKFINAYQNSYYLALARSIITKDTIKPLIVKAYNNSKALATSQGIINKETVKDIIGKVYREASYLNKKVNN